MTVNKSTRKPFLSKKITHEPAAFFGYCPIDSVLWIYFRQSAAHSLYPADDFIATGFAVGRVALDHILTNLTLILALFSDASRIELKLLYKEHTIPLRLLLIGRPLTIGLLRPAWEGLLP